MMIVRRGTHAAAAIEGDHRTPLQYQPRISWRCLLRTVALHTKPGTIARRTGFSFPDNMRHARSDGSGAPHLNWLS